MQSEVRKVLDTNAYYITGSVYEKLDAAERADAAKREEPVQALRQFIDKWQSMSLVEASYTRRTMLQLVSELNAIIATKPESQPVTASEPSVTFGASPKLTLPAGKPAGEHIRAIAEQAVRDAMPDVMDGLAETFGEAGFSTVTNAFREHAVKLRKERGA